MSSLNQLLDMSREIEARLIESEGLITPEIEQLTYALDISLPEKVDSYGLVIDRMEANAEWFKQQALKYSQIQKGIEMARDNLRDRLKELMRQHGLTELQGRAESFKLSPSKPKLIISDEKQIPDRFIVETRTFSPDKDAIREALNRKEKVEGCELEETFALRKYVKKG